MRYRTVIYDGGLIDKQEAATIFEARALCKVYVKEHEGAAIFDTKKGVYVEYYNAFPINEIAPENRVRAIHKATPEYVKKSLLYPIYGYMFAKKMIEKGE